MGDVARTQEGTPIGGWALRVDRRAFDVTPMVEAYGQIYRHPLPPGPRTELLRPGQPCFWYADDRSRVVGLWGVGEVVGEVWASPIDPEDPSAGEQLQVEVEIYPLAKPISVDQLRADPALAAGELLSAEPPANPIVLTPAEVKAIEALDFEIVAPSEDQLARLDEQLAAEDAGA